MVYDPKKEQVIVDKFGPVADESFRLPEEVKLEWIGNHEDIVKLDALMDKDEKYIGVDSEWRPQLAKFHKTAPSLF